jgi:catechol 2,3-dioxygenase-like lactoylglutathione lyase family enzyme
MEYRLEVFVLPVSDVDRAKAFYEQLGFHCDVDHQASPEFRVVQFTPPGSGCSVTFGDGMPVKAKPGDYHGIHLIVDDVVLAVADLRGRGVDVSDPFHFGQNGQTPGVHPGSPRPDFGTYAQFADPDGNVWLLQEVPSRAGKAWGLS